MAYDGYFKYVNSQGIPNYQNDLEGWNLSLTVPDFKNLSQINKFVSKIDCKATEECDTGIRHMDLWNKERPRR